MNLFIDGMTSSAATTRAPAALPGSGLLAVPAGSLVAVLALADVRWGWRPTHINQPTQCTESHRSP